MTPQAYPVEWPQAPTAVEYLQIGLQHTRLAENRDQSRDRACADFRRFHAISLANVLTPDLLALVLRLAEEVPYEITPDRLGTRATEATPQRTGRILNLAVNRPVLRRWIAEVTGCGPLYAMEGRVSQMVAGRGDALTWHDDHIDGEQRRLALVLNLTTQPFTGGEFQLRRKTGEPIFAHRYDQPNSALLFAVDPALEHRVLPLTAGGPRRNFAGWAFAEASTR